MRSVVQGKGRAMFLRNFKRHGRKKDALMMLFIRYWDLEIQTCFCHFFFRLVYQVIWLICCCSFAVYGTEVISEVLKLSCVSGCVK